MSAFVHPPEIKLKRLCLSDLRPRERTWGELATVAGPRSLNYKHTRPRNRVSVACGNRGVVSFRSVQRGHLGQRFIAGVVTSLNSAVIILHYGVLPFAAFGVACLN